MRAAVPSLVLSLCLSVSAAAQNRFIFPESSNGDYLLAEAVGESVIASKRVLIFWGSNDSAACQELDRVLVTDQKVQDVLEPEYVVVRMNSKTNADLANSLAVRIDGIPAISVVDPFQGLVAHRALPAADASQVLGFLYQHRKRPSQAENVFDRARDAAGAQDKALFVLFTTTWCGWCNKLKETLSDPTIAPVISRYMTYIEIDQENVEGARALRYRLSQNTYGGIPWYTAVTPGGDVLAATDGTRGIAGYPSGSRINEIMALFRRAAPDMTAEEREELRTNLLRVTRFATRPNEPTESDAKLTIK